VVTGAADATRASFVPTLARAATDADGSPPFSDQTLVDVRSGVATVVGDPHRRGGAARR
jgi:mycothiol synthase